MTERDEAAGGTEHATAERGAHGEPAGPAPAETVHTTVVGIGASAGGLAALKELFARVPEQTGVAWVVVVHLSPEHESHLPSLLQAHTALPVQQVTETLKLEPDRVYVIPPNANLDAIDTHLRLSALEERRAERAPIDHFLRTLSRTHNGHAVGVILSGTGSDGTLGIKEIKEKGGLAVVQDPDEAEYSGMPRSAIATGLVDLVLPLAEIPGAVLGYAHTEPHVVVPDGDGDADAGDRRLLQKVFAHLRARTDRDFSHYKRSTVLRRISRRMQLRHVEDLSDYLRLLREDREEAQSLADDLLITVTSFFRDAEVFDALAADVIPSLFEGRGPEDEIRVWSVGCATGEEAYSLTMLLLEEAERRELPPKIQIFASDLHARSLARARQGYYPGDIQTDVNPDRLARFFTQEDHGYRIRKEVRDRVLFAPHNLLGDPPFSRIDLISCRNVLIYLQREIQPDVYDLFHYALRPNGVLVLGTSERLDAAALFRILDKKHQIYRKRDLPGPQPRLPVFPLARHRIGASGGWRARSDDRPRERVALGALHQRMVERYAMPSLLVDPEDRVIHVSEHAGRYLVVPGGELTSNVIKLVREELRIELRAALHAVREQDRPQQTRPVDVRLGNGRVAVALDVRPSPDPGEHGYVLVVFNERPPGPEPGRDEGDEGVPDVASARVRTVELERDRARERLQTVSEEYETSREEMKTSNEELQSMNEELRSTMEELETGKEELQSINEELQTVNQENRHKMEELARLSSDLQNLLAATDIATVFLDRELRIVRFTPALADLFSVRMTDRGRPLSDLTHRLVDGDLITRAEEVLETLVPFEGEVEDEGGRWYLTRIMPYRSAEERIEGLVITFVDVTDRRSMEDELRAQKEFAQNIVDTLHEPLLVLRDDLTVQSANPSFYRHFRVGPEATEGRLVYELGNGQWDIPALRELLEDVLPENQAFDGFRVTHEFADIGRGVMLVNARRLDRAPLILLGIRDITEETGPDDAAPDA